MKKEIKINITSNVKGGKEDAIFGLLTKSGYDTIQAAVDRLSTRKLKDLAKIVHGRMYKRMQ